MEQINIKDKEAYQLAKELSLLTGENITQAVIHSISERVERIKRKRHIQDKNSVKSILEIGNACASLPTLDAREVNEILYNEQGLPKNTTK